MSAALDPQLDALARRAYHSGKGDELNELWRHLMSEFPRHPDSPDVAAALAHLYFKFCDPYTARAYALRALGLDPGHPRARDAFVAAEREIAKEGFVRWCEPESARSESMLPGRLTVLFAAGSLFPPVGGAELSALAILRALVRRGHEALGVCLSPDGSKRDIIHDNMKLILVPGPEDIMSIVRRLRPDVVLTQLEYAPQVVSLAHALGVPSVLFVRGHEFYCAKPLKMSRCSFDCESCRPAEFSDWFERSQRAIEHANLVVCRSKYVRGNVESFFRRKATVVYPLVDGTEVLVEKRHPEFVTLAGSLRHKGIDLFLDIAEARKELRFLVAGEPCFRAVPSNVACLGQVDPRVYLAHTRVLLVPSQWPEPIGRAAIEAIANGIPVAASRVGGLGEAVGDAGILVDDFGSKAAWLEALDRLIHDGEFAEELSRRGRQRFGVFESTVQWLKLEYELAHMLEAVQGASRRAGAGGL